MIGKDNVHLVIQAMTYTEEKVCRPLIVEIAGKLNQFIKLISPCYDILLPKRKTFEIKNIDDAESIEFR